MILNYIKIALRNFGRQKTFSAINISGLAIGLAGSFAILLYVLFEFSFDTYHENADRIFRVVTRYKDTGAYSAASPYQLAPLMQGEIPVNTKFARIMTGEALIKYDKTAFWEDKLFKADPEIFEIFSFQFIKGDPSTALNNPNSIVITDKTAKKYFGEDDPVGKVLTLRIKKGLQVDIKPYYLTVTGVIENFPVNSHLKADFIIPISSVYWGYENIDRTKAVPSFESMMSFSAYTYFMMPEGFAPGDYYPRDYAESYKSKSGTEYPVMFQYQPLKEIHLNSMKFADEIEAQGNMNNIYIFSSIALLILIIAIINYIVLSTARAATRAKEVGVRKVIGAMRSDLARQLMTESSMISIAALPIALGFSVFIMPHLNQLLGVNLSIDNFFDWKFITGFVFITMLAGIISGGYISFYMSSFNPVDVLKSKINSGSAKTYFRSSLIVFQLSIFIVLIISTSIIYSQILFMTDDSNLGFEKENVISVHINDRNFKGMYGAFKNAILQNPSIESVSSSMADPPATNMLEIRSFEEKKDVTPGEDKFDIKIIEQNRVDFDFINTLGLEIVAGRPFSKEISGDKLGVVVNETYIKEHEIEDPVGNEIDVLGEKRKIIGVVKDFHAHSLYEKIMPLVLFNGTDYINQVIVRVKPGEGSSAISFLRKEWNKIVPESPFEYSYLDDTLENMYRSEYKFGEIIGSFTLLAIIVASLGLFGLTLFIAEQRKNEISIRKVFGASTSRIMKLITYEFVILVFVANIIAWPFAWYYMNKWLQDFAYRVNLEWWIFASSGLLSFIIAMMTIGFHALKAARANPVNAIRYE